MTNSHLLTDKLTEEILDEVEVNLKKIVSLSGEPDYQSLQEILTYQLGWEGDGAGPNARGKRIRPLILLLTNAACGAEWINSLYAASAVELLHNFSLIHDDIEDNSPLRRGRPTIWKKWGVAQAINAGDAMFTLSYIALLHLYDLFPPELVLDATRVLNKTCLLLTQGQHLDISYENCMDLTVEAYWPMVRGKTAALLASCAEIGAILARVNPTRQRTFRNFGHALGLAFQVQDDLLGIWGDENVTGKSSESDLQSGKKSLPILYGLGLKGSFAKRWNQGPIQANEIADVAKMLEDEGGYEYTKRTALRLTRLAFQDLEAANPVGTAGETLKLLVDKLLTRTF